MLGTGWVKDSDFLDFWHWREKLVLLFFASKKYKKYKEPEKTAWKTEFVIKIS